ncbi:histidine phosphatase family protein [[Mycobacterium] burgundiense]|jgi:broad specificity phosphatase PhoE|uniref:Histidine phosphatase family protein n=1 Tax=[Mycobacterium] burgundiense TaxID=3064286 RepID=A0ABM9M0I4_9MYCO|nr:histidine phosphatase family protein [Mycolicibacterium sp. MU0053]CAJ1507942.1 histidine phosphatase family protein [Mycolicibacterium sp. MU0053]
MPHAGLLGGKALAALFAVTVVGACSSGPPPPPSITLTLVRHAESEGNISGVIDTSVPGPGLTPEGKQQAEDLADELRGKDFDGIYASNMVRTAQTAAPLAADLGEQVEVLPGLREIEAGWFEGKPEDQIATTYFLAPVQWLEGNMDAAVPGSVSGKEFNDRFTGAVQEIYASGDKNPVAVAHAGSIMLWTLLNTVNSRESLLQTRPLPNTAIVVLEGNPITGWRLVSWDGLTL